MALRGNLRDFSLPDVFQLVTLSGKTGVLRMKREDAEGSVWFRDGAVFFAQSDWQREPLGTRLVTAGKTTPSALTKALEIQRAEPAGGRRLGQILVDEGYVTDKVLEAFVQEQIQDTIFDLFRWDEGDFDFETLDSIPEEDIGLSVSIENVVMEGSRRLEEWNRIKKKIPSMDIVFKMATAPGEGTFDISLKPTEWTLLLKVDGTRAVAELARETGRTDFEVARIVYGLFSAGLLEVASDEEVARLRAERESLDAAIAAPAEVAVASVPVSDWAAPLAAPAAAAAAPHIVEEPAFLSTEQEAASAQDVSVFQEMMGAVLEAPAETPPMSRAVEPTVEPTASIAAPAAPGVTPAEPALPAASAVYVFEDEVAVSEPPAPAEAVAPVVAPEAEASANAGEPSVVSSEADLSRLLETLEAAQTAPASSDAHRVPTVAEPASVQAPAPVPPTTGDFAADLMALGLGELPASDLLAPLRVQAPDHEPTIAEIEAAAKAADSGEATIAEIEAAALASMPDAAAGAIEEPVAAPPPVPDMAPSDLSDLLGSLSEPGGTEVLDTSGALPDAVAASSPDQPGESSSGGVISTDAYLADFGSTEVSFSTGLGDEITALTGGGGGRQRPTVNVAKIPEAPAEGQMLHRDRHVDRDLLLRIIEGVRTL